MYDVTIRHSVRTPSNIEKHVILCVKYRQKLDFYVKIVNMQFSWDFLLNMFDYDDSNLQTKFRVRITSNSFKIIQF